MCIFAFGNVRTNTGSTSAAKRCCVRCTQTMLCLEDINEKIQADWLGFFWQGQKDLVSSLRRKVEEYFDFATRLRSVAALTVHRTVIHYRSPSSPSVSNPSKTKRTRFLRILFYFGRGRRT